MIDFRVKNSISKAVAAVLVTTCLAMASVAAQANPITGLKPAYPQPDAANLKPGLAVVYYGVEVNSLDQLEDHIEYYKDDPGKGKQGTPIPMLNYSVGSGDVLTSGSEDMVGAIINGFIKMEKPGRYTMLVHSNDGVYIAIGDKLIYEDPDVHADRFSDELVLEVSEPGWYPIHVKYFEKKNTSTLELYWETPGGGDMDFVPASAFAHLKE